MPNSHGESEMEENFKASSGFYLYNRVSLVEGMKKMMPIYHLLGRIPAVRNISNKIIVMKR